MGLALRSRSKPSLRSRSTSRVRIATSSEDSPTMKTDSSTPKSALEAPSPSSKTTYARLTCANGSGTVYANADKVSRMLRPSKSTAALECRTNRPIDISDPCEPIEAPITLVQTPHSISDTNFSEDGDVILAPCEAPQLLPLKTPQPMDRLVLRLSRPGKA